MKIACIADQHGYLPDPVTMPPADTLVIAGDVCPVTDHDIDFQHNWLENDFNNWLKRIPYRNKVMVAGNHDLIFEHATPKLYCDYLQESSVIIDHIKFYGYPHTPEFCDWAFNCTKDELTVIAGRIPADTNVLITHGPPLGTMDSCLDWNVGGTVHVGCSKLRKRIQSLHDLKLHVFGHIHPQHGIWNDPRVTYINASYVNDKYKPDYQIECYIVKEM